jgi:ABC-type uncharacterized transport system permease subunit
MGRLNQSVTLAIHFVKAHLASQWSTQSNFWSGIIGMLVNNYLTLLGVWAMLFAGKESLERSSQLFFIMNFVLMLAWGIVHVFFGGIANLDQQITSGALDSVLVVPRSPFFLLALTKSDLPAWGDIILGFLGLLAYSFKFGLLFFAQSIFVSIFATLALFAIYLLIGSLTFWFRRTELIQSVVINICLAFNTYPITHSGTGLRWFFYWVPILFIGVVPADFIVSPKLTTIFCEIVGSLGLLYLAKKIFKLGLKRYQSYMG